MSDTVGYNTSQGGKDPITAIANAAGDIFKSVFGFLSMGKQKQIEQERTRQVEELTEQERIRYYQLVKQGNSQLASQMLLIASNRDKDGQLTNTLIIGGVVIAIILIIILKTRK